MHTADCLSYVMNLVSVSTFGVELDKRLQLWLYIQSFAKTESGARYFQPQCFKGNNLINLNHLFEREQKMRSVQSIIFQSSKAPIKDKKFIK